MLRNIVEKLRVGSNNSEHENNMKLVLRFIENIS